MTPKLFRVTLEVGDLEIAVKFYSNLLAVSGERHPGSRHYFQCGGVILAILDVANGGTSPSPSTWGLYFAKSDIASVHERAAALEALAPYQVHGQPAGEVLDRPWGERSCYVVDPWGNDLCFVEEGSLYT